MSGPETERVFRNFESTLDAVLAGASERILGVGIAIVDKGNRKRLDVGHGLDKLAWGVFLERIWARGSDTHFATLRLSYEEPFTPNEPPTLYGSLYVGVGSPTALSGKVHSNEAKHMRVPSVSIDHLTDEQFAKFVISTMEKAVHES